MYEMGSPRGGGAESPRSQSPRLKKLILDDRALTGSAWLDDVDPLSLDEIRAQRCQIVDLGPVCRETKLQVLRLNNNSISSIPAGFGQLMALTGLDLSHNRIGPELPAVFCALPKLDKLLLRSNLISSVPAQASALTRLSRLCMASNPPAWSRDAHSPTEVVALVAAMLGEGGAPRKSSLGSSSDAAAASAKASSPRVRTATAPASSAISPRAAAGPAKATATLVVSALPAEGTKQGANVATGSAPATPASPTVQQGNASTTTPAEKTPPASPKLADGVKQVTIASTAASTEKDAAEATKQPSAVASTATPAEKTASASPPPVKQVTIAPPTEVTKQQGANASTATPTKGRATTATTSPRLAQGAKGASGTAAGAQSDQSKPAAVAVSPRAANGHGSVAISALSPKHVAIPPLKLESSGTDPIAMGKQLPDAPLSPAGTSPRAEDAVVKGQSPRTAVAAASAKATLPGESPREREALEQARRAEEQRLAAEDRALQAEKARLEAERKARKDTERLRAGMEADRIALEAEHRKEWDDLSSQLAQERIAREAAERRLLELSQGKEEVPKPADPLSAAADEEISKLKAQLAEATADKLRLQLAVAEERAKNAENELARLKAQAPKPEEDPPSEPTQAGGKSPRKSPRPSSPRRGGDGNAEGESKCSVM